MKKLTITIGIPAYNEEANIGNLLSSVLSQKGNNFELKKIFVISDTSNDETDKKVSEFNDKRIQLIRNKRRQGQIFSQNLIFSLSKTDVVVLLEADTLLKENEYLQNLITPICKKQSIGLVQGNIEPLAPKTLIEKILTTQFTIYHNFIIKEPKIISLFCSGRGGRAFSRNVYKSLIWPLSVPEDIFALLWCKQHNIRTEFQRSAIGIYRCPQTFSDYVKERQKIKSAKVASAKYFSQELVNTAYAKPVTLTTQIAFTFLKANFRMFILYLILKFKTKYHLQNAKFTDCWQKTNSTKKLIET